MLVALLACGLAAHAQDDINNLLESIPEIEQGEVEVEIDPATIQAAEDEADFGTADPKKYTAQIQQAVMATWKLKKKHARAQPPLTAKLLIKIHSDGTVKSIGAMHMSTDKKFNKTLTEAVKAAAPFPKPPVVLRKHAIRGVVVDFDSSNYGG